MRNTPTHRPLSPPLVPMPPHTLRQHRCSSPTLAALCFGAALAGCVLGWLSIHPWPLSRSAALSSPAAVHSPAPRDSADSTPDAFHASPTSPWTDRWEETTALASTPAR